MIENISLSFFMLFYYNFHSCLEKKTVESLKKPFLYINYYKPYYYWNLLVLGHWSDQFYIVFKTEVLIDLIILILLNK